MINENDRVAQENIRTVNRNFTSGALIDKDTYQAIKAFIISTLKTEMPVNELISRCHDHFLDQLKDSTGWIIYNVKIDLEERGVIESVRVKNRRSYITLTRLRPAGVQRLEHRIKSENAVHPIKPNIEVKNKFIELFDTTPMIVHSPATLNLLGDGACYSNGQVLSATLTSGIQFAFGLADNQAHVYSLNDKQIFTIDLHHPQKGNATWQNLFAGVIHRLTSRGYLLKGFNCVFNGDIPSGVGLSSSTALTCGFIAGLNELLALNISPDESASIGQWVDERYAKNAVRKVNHLANFTAVPNRVTLIDRKLHLSTAVPWIGRDHSILLLDLGIRNTSVAGVLQKRFEECEEGLDLLREKFPHIVTMRDVTTEMLEQDKHLLSDNIFKRCLFVLHEGVRIETAVQSLRNNNFQSFGQTLFTSHEELSSLYDITCVEAEFLIELIRKTTGAVGARLNLSSHIRSVVVVVENEAMGQFINHITLHYREQFGHSLTVIPLQSGGPNVVLEQIARKSIL